VGCYIFDLIAPIKQLVVGQSTVEEKQAEVEDLHLEEAVVAKIAMAREAGLLGN
jgi:hypothetical protein